MSEGVVSRRSVLGGVSAVTVGAGILSACSTTPTKKNDQQSNSKVTLPAYVPWTKAKPDFEGTDDGVMAGFLAYPSPPVKATDGPPGKGGAVRALTQLDVAAPPTLDRNAHWQNLNKRLGVDLQMTMAPAADYQSKLATAIAGGDLPDLVYFRPNIVPRIPQVMRELFTDISEYVSGDAVKSYPFLANIPTISWKSAIHNGGIYGIPIPRGTWGSVIMYRQDVFEKRGLNPSVSNADEFFTLLKELTNPNKNEWAVASPAGLLTAFLQMLKAPNNWRNDNGKFTHAYETEEYLRAIEALARAKTDGVLHPDAFAAKQAQINTWFFNSSVPISIAGWGGWGAYIRDQISNYPDMRIGAIVPPGFDGGDSVHFLAPGNAGFTAFTKSDPKRIKDLLEIANWMTTPFGTEERIARRSGVEGVDFTFKGTDPVLTPTGITETQLPVLYVFSEPLALFQAGFPDVTKTQFPVQHHAVTKLGLQDASVGLYSETASSQGPTLAKKMQDFAFDIAQGRRKPADWATAVTEWKRDGGETIRTEYQTAYEEAN